MKRSFQFLLGFILLVCSNKISAQIDTKFWFAPPDVSNLHDQSDNYIEIRLASVADVPVTVTITQPANPGSIVNKLAPIVIPVGQSSTVNLSTIYGNYKDVLETVDGAVRNTGLLITSTGPITAYYEVGRASSIPGNPIPDKNGEIFSLKGANALGTHFYTPFQNIYSNNFGGNSSIDVVAVDDNTVVTFKLTKPGLVGTTVIPAGVNYSVTLNKGQTYSVRANGINGGDHLSGSEVTSTKPIAVTQKDDSVQSWSYGADIIGDQLVPTNVVGTEYIVPRGYLSNNLGNPPFDRNEVFIVPTVPGTTISVDGNVVATNLNAGALFPYVLSSANGVATFAQTITSNNPVYVYYLSGYGSEMGGPLLPPLKCTGSSKVSFVRSSSDPFFLTIISRTEGIGSFIVEGRKDIITAADFTFDAGNGWKVAQKRMDATALSPTGMPVNIGITVENSTSYFHLGIINGQTTGGTSRFGYFSDFGKIVSQLPDVLGVCPGVPFTLDPKVVGLDSLKTKWFLLPDDVNPVYVGSKFNGLKDGKYKITLVDTRACQINDTVTISSFTVTPFHLPKSSDTVCFNIVEPINVGGTWSNVKWTTTPAGVTIPANTTSYNPGKSGIYQVTVTDVNNCIQKDQVAITYDESLKSFDLGPDNSTVCFNVVKPIVVPSGAYSSVIWTAPVSILAGTTTYNPVNSGLYKVAVSNSFGCANADQVNVNYADGLKNFDLGPATSTVCFNVNNPIVVAGGPYNSVKWTAPITIADGTLSYDPKQSGTYKVTVGDAFGCSASDQIAVTFDQSLSNFDLGPDNSTVCFNVSKPIVVSGGPYALVKWTAPVTIADGTSTFDPKQSGTYKVTISNAAGCSNSDQVNVTYDDGLKNFDLGPSTSTVCFNASKPIIVAGGPYQTVKWTAPVTIADGTLTFDPKQSGTYKVTVGDALGCSASDQIAVTFDQSLSGFDLGPDNSTVCFNVSKPIVVTGGPYASVKWAAPVVITDGTTTYDPKQSGTYKVSVSNAAGCSNADQVNVTYSDGLKNFDLGPASSIVCFNVSKPIIVPGGPYNSIKWAAPVVIPDQTTTYDPKQSGTYKVTVGDAFGCFANDQVAVTFDQSLSGFDLGPDNSTVCFNVSKPIVVSGGPYSSIKWVAPVIITDGTTSYDPKQSGSYKVTVSNSNSCSNSDQVNVNYSDGLKNFDLGPDNSTVCFNVAKPIQVSGGPYATIRWTAPVTIPDGTTSYNPQQNGTFKVTVGDAFGCFANDQVTVTYDQTLKAFDLGPDKSTVCFNVSKPIVVPGGPYASIKWSAPVSITDGTTNYDPKQSGLYKVTVFNIAGCSNNDQVDVTYADGLAGFGLSNGKNPVCFSDPKPIIVAGGPYQSVIWTAPETVTNGTTTFSPKKTGNYSVTVGDVYGCSSTKSVDIVYVPDYGLDLGKKLEVCSYTGYVINATKPGIVTYEWSTNVPTRVGKLPGPTESTYKPDTSGKYAVKIIDANGCFDRDTLQLDLVNDLSLDLGVDKLTCSYENYTISVAGNYLTYEWSNDAGLPNPSANVSKFQPIKSGKYAVKVTDQSGQCHDQDTISIVYVPAFNFSLGKASDTVCFNVVKPIKSTDNKFNTGYTWVWSVPAGESVPPNATSYNPGSSGVYAVTVTDPNGCRDSSRVAITFSNTLLNFDLGNPDDTICYNVADTIRAIDHKFDKGFTWAWSVPKGSTDPGNAVYAIPKSSGVYKATITDQFLCHADDQVTVKFSNRLLNFDLGNSIDTACFNTALPIQATDRKFDHGFVWAWTVPAGEVNPNGSTSIIPTTGGTFRVDITDSLKCHAMDTVLVKFSNLTFGFNLGAPNDTVCFNVADTIRATDHKFDQGYTWTWNVPAGATDPATNVYALPNKSGIYKATVQDVLKCQASDEVTILFSDDLITFDLGAPLDTVCFNVPVLIQATDTKYNQGFTWSWDVPAGADNPGTATKAAPKVSGLYKATILDRYLCRSSDTVLIKFSDLTSGFDLGAGQDTACYGRADTIQALNQKFNAGFQWSWTVPTGVDDPRGATFILPQKGGVYKVTVTDRYSCKNSDEVLVRFSNALLDFDLGGPSDTVCFNVADTIKATNSKYNNGYVWSWQVPSGTSDPGGATFALPKSSGKYKVNISDSLKCTATDEVVITFGNSLLNFKLGKNASAFCALKPDTIRANDISYNNKNYQWHWTVPAGSSDPGGNYEILPLVEGDYTVTITDTLFCQATDHALIRFLPPIQVDLGAMDTVACSYADYTISAGSGFANYKWSNNVAGSKQPTFKPKMSGTYWVEVTDVNGCKGSDTINVTYIPPINVSLGSSEVTVCSNNTEPVILTPGNTYTAYLWPDGSTKPTFNVSYPIDKNTASSERVWVKVWNRICTATDTITVNFINFEAITLGDEVSVCKGDTVKLDAGPTFFSYSWTSAENPDSLISENQILRVTKDGLYFLDVNNNCGFLRLSKKVSFYALPDASLSYVISKYPTDTLKGDTAFYCYGQEVNVVLKPGYAIYQWTMGDDPTVVEDTLNKKIEEDGTYQVKIISKEGCVSNNSIVAVSNDNCFYIPNLITPNGDGVNETFAIEGIKKKTWSVEIYNRWGEKVYTNPGYENDWGGQTVTDGVYYYNLHSNYRAKTYKGWVQVVGNAHP